MTPAISPSGPREGTILVSYLASPISATPAQDSPRSATQELLARGGPAPDLDHADTAVELERRAPDLHLTPGGPHRAQGAAFTQREDTVDTDRPEDDGGLGHHDPQPDRAWCSPSRKDTAGKTVINI
jgi:hypothetical protein